MLWFPSSLKRCERSVSARLWWAPLNPWTMSSKLARGRFLRTLHVWNRSAMSFVMCSRKRWEEGKADGNKESAAPTFSLLTFGNHFSLLSLCLFRLFVRMVVMMMQKMKINRLAELLHITFIVTNTSYGRESDWKGYFVEFDCDCFLNPDSCGLTLCSSCSGRVRRHAPGVCRRRNPPPGFFCPCRQLCSFSQWPASSHHEQNCKSGPKYGRFAEYILIS